jgi:hypothetical protein
MHPHHDRGPSSSSATYEENEVDPLRFAEMQQLCAQLSQTPCTRATRLAGYARLARLFEEDRLLWHPYVSAWLGAAGDGCALRRARADLTHADRLLRIAAARFLANLCVNNPANPMDAFDDGFNCVAGTRQVRIVHVPQFIHDSYRQYLVATHGSALVDYTHNVRGGGGGRGGVIMTGGGGGGGGDKDDDNASGNRSGLIRYIKRFVRAYPRSGYRSHAYHEATLAALPYVAAQSNMCQHKVWCFPAYAREYPAFPDPATHLIGFVRVRDAGPRGRRPQYTHRTNAMPAAARALIARTFAMHNRDFDELEIAFNANEKKRSTTAPTSPVGARSPASAAKDARTPTTSKRAAAAAAAAAATTADLPSIGAHHHHQHQQQNFHLHAAQRRDKSAASASSPHAASSGNASSSIAQDRLINHSLRLMLNMAASTGWCCESTPLLFVTFFFFFFFSF